MSWAAEVWAALSGDWTYLPLTAVLLTALWRVATDRRPSALAAALLSFFGLTLAALWEWGRTGDQHWSGLPFWIGLSQPQQHEFRLIALTASASFLAIGLCLRFGPSEAETVEVERRTPALPRIGLPVLLAGNVAVLLVWLAGQGPSVMHRDVYLEVDGLLALVRLSSIVLVPFLVVNALAGVQQSRWSGRLLVAALQLGWGGLATAVGSRIGFIALLLLAGQLGVYVWRRVDESPETMIGLLLRGAAGVGVVVVLLVAAASSTWAYEARFRPHGLRPLITALSGGGGFWEYAGPDGALAAMRGMAASVGAAAPVLVMSAERPLSLSILGQIVNPTPRALMPSSASFEALLSQQELILPWTWVPKGALGEFQAAGGTLLLVAVCLVVGLMLDLLATQLHGLHGRYARLLALMPLGLTFLLCIAAVQYPARQFSRLLVIVALVSVTTLVIGRRAKAETPPGPAAKRPAVRNGGSDLRSQEVFARPRLD